MPSLFATLTVVEEFHLFVLRKQFHKKVKKVCKKVYKKLKSAIHKPDKRRIHCEKTPTFCSVAVQTSFEPLIQSLSHGGELDMSYHLNSNQNNNRGFSRPLRPSQGSSTGHTKPPRGNLLPDKHGVNPPSSKKSTSSVSTSTNHSSVPRRQYPSEPQRHQGYSSGGTKKSVSTETTTLPKIGAQSPKPIRHSSSFSGSSKSHTFSSVPYMYPPKPPSNPPPPISPARQKRRHEKKTTTKMSNTKMTPQTNLHRSASLSSITTSMSNSYIGDVRDYLQSENSWSGNPVPEFLKVITVPVATKAEETPWSGNPVPEFLKVITVPVATKAEETPVTRTLVPYEGRHVKPLADTASPRREMVPYEGRHVKPVADIASPRREVPKMMSYEGRHVKLVAGIASPRREVPKSSVDKPDSPIRVFTKFLHSLKKRVKSKHTQITPPGLEGALMTGGIVGLTNLGNTCFMNSALQCLSHTLEMTQEFLRTDCHTERKNVGKAYARLMQDMWFKASPLRSRAANPHAVKTALARVHSTFAGYSQQDSQELLRLLLSELHEEMKANSKQDKSNKLVPITAPSGDVGDEKWWSYFQHEDTPISRVFMGQLRSTLICDTCKEASTTFDPFWDLALPIPKSAHGSMSGLSYIITKYQSGLSLVDCISHFTKEEILDGSNKAYCTKCRSLRRTCKQMKINRFPPVLVMYCSVLLTEPVHVLMITCNNLAHAHLQRFSVQSYRTKLDTHVDIPTELDLTSYASKESVEGMYSGQRIQYELYAISNHMGGVTFGHYTALVKHYATDQWYLCNDSSVQRVTNIDRYLKNSAPYMMFYRRTLSTAE